MATGAGRWPSACRLLAERRGASVPFVDAGPHASPAGRRMTALVARSLVATQLPTDTCHLLSIRDPHGQGRPTPLLCAVVSGNPFGPTGDLS